MSSQHKLQQKRTNTIHPGRTNSWRRTQKWAAPFESKGSVLSRVEASVLLSEEGHPAQDYQIEGADGRARQETCCGAICRRSFLEGLNRCRVT